MIAAVIFMFAVFISVVFLEKGKYNPSLKSVHDIAKIFKLNTEEVFIFDD